MVLRTQFEPTECVGGWKPNLIEISGCRMKVAVSAVASFAIAPYAQAAARLLQLIGGLKRDVLPSLCSSSQARAVDGPGVGHTLT